MATQPPGAAALPLLYRGLEPLNSGQHSNMKLKRGQTIPGVGQVHAIPITIDEFIHAQRNYPIIFSAGDTPVPLALMGLNEDVNTFIDSEGMPIDQNAYMPAYLRRYPFMLAKLRPDSDELSLCFDPTAGSVAEDGEEALFDGDQPSELTRNILAFCEQFETAGQRTHAFMEEVAKLDLLMEGEVSIQPDGVEQPFLYRGFRMIDEEKLRNLRGDELRKINQNGVLSLLMAHLFSLGLIRDLFFRQVQQGKGPQGLTLPTANAAAPEAKVEDDAKA
ncbi:SapC family protein [Sphingomonas mesophila]|uniref:SapC family protein n=1 Tax=Sphingomonas mesophila TaxID=2303576 RepID=UPI000E57C915|nr:SapC family protein [Sphingomonas mesophila]